MLLWLSSATGQDDAVWLINAIDTGVSCDYITENLIPPAGSDNQQIQH